MSAAHDWIEPLVFSAAATVVAVPVVKRVAVATGFLDRPAPHKVHPQPTPYLGGAAICIGVLVAVLVARTTVHSGVIGAAAAVLFAAGLVDDRRGMPPLVKLAIQGAAAVVVFVIGFHLQAEGVWIHLTGVKWVDLIPTFALFILIPNSVNLLDNTDGCAAGVVAASTACVLAETIVRGQDQFSIAAAAMEGALLGFLVYNRRPASIFMGDAGSLPLGLLLAVMATRAGVGVQAPVCAEATFLLLGIPLADTATVFIARVLHGRSIFQGGQDHLSHRLAASGLSIGYATWTLIVAQAGMGVVAIALAMGQLGGWWALGFGLAMLSAVVVPAARPTINRIVYRVSPQGAAPEGVPLPVSPSSGAAA